MYLFISLENILLPRNEAAKKDLLHEYLFYEKNNILYRQESCVYHVIKNWNIIETTPY